jgi:hypothetical protein
VAKDLPLFEATITIVIIAEINLKHDIIIINTSD